MYISRIRIALLFYRHYCIIPTLLWVPGVWLCRAHGPLAAVLLLKAAANALAWYAATNRTGSGLYYCYNLHVPRSMLFATWTFTDLILFSILLWLTAGI